METIRLDGMQDDRVRIIAGVEVLAEYVHRPADPQLESPRPYFSPGPHACRRGRLALPPARPRLAQGHRLVVAVVGDENFWGGPTFVRGEGYVQLPNNGTQRHREFTRAGGCRSRRRPSRPPRRGARLGDRGRRDVVRRAAHHRRRDARRRRVRRGIRRVAPRLRDPHAQRHRARDPDRLADDPGARERRLRRAVLARSAFVHRWRRARPGCRGRRRAARHACAVDGLLGPPRRLGRGIHRGHDRRPCQRAASAAVVRPPRGVRVPLPGAVLQRGARGRVRRDARAAIRRRRRRRGERSRAGSAARRCGIRRPSRPAGRPDEPMPARRTAAARCHRPAAPKETDDLAHPAPGRHPRHRRDRERARDGARRDARRRARRGRRPRRRARPRIRRAVGRQRGRRLRLPRRAARERRRRRAAHLHPAGSACRAGDRRARRRRSTSSARSRPRSRSTSSTR